MAFDGRLLGGISVLAAVVETGNFVRAAEALGLTQSGVSRAVARLEARIGVRLLDRTPRAVSLTDEGRRFHTQVAPLLAGLQEAASEVAEASHAIRGRLKVNVDPWFARLVLAPRLSGLLAAHPQLSLELVARDTLGDLVSEGFDVAVRFGEPEPSGLIARKLLDTRILTCAAPAYLARCGRPRHPRDLERHECLLFRDPVTGRPFAWEFHRAGKVSKVKVVIVSQGLDDLFRFGFWLGGEVLLSAFGFAAFERGDYPADINALAPLAGETERIGGSRAQHDLIEFTLLKAYLNAGRLEEARYLLSARRPGASGVPVTGVAAVH